MRTYRIYIIYSVKLGKCYIGLTTKSLKDRLCTHRCDVRKYEQGFRPKVGSYDVMKEDDCRIELLTEITTENREEALVLETYYIDKYKNTCLNKYRTEPKEETPEQKQRRLRKLEVNRRKVECDWCGGHYTANSLARHKRESCLKNVQYV